MAEIILHHYPTSTFSERVRLAFGLKGLSWRSVIIPGAMPKPDLLPLTGGYRRTPVMQIGADIYCDTLLILRTIESLHPEPSLYPDGSEGIATALAWWADKSIFAPSLGVVADTIGHTIPADFVAERKAFGFPLSREDVAPVLHRHLQQGAAHLGVLATMLADGRPFILGQPSAADLAAYGPLWLLRTQGGAEAEARLPTAPLRDWYDRVAAFGHGRPRDLSAAEALAIAADAEPGRPAIADDSDPSGLKAGMGVVVRADDTGRDPVRGTLLAAGPQEMVIRSTDPRVGDVNIHFPRAGFDVVPAEPA
ncbi:MAG: glutathione S-transferase family protein [Microvirga sp.]